MFPDPCLQGDCQSTFFSAQMILFRMRSPGSCSELGPATARATGQRECSSRMAVGTECASVSLGGKGQARRRAQTVVVVARFASLSLSKGQTVRPGVVEVRAVSVSLDRRETVGLGGVAGSVVSLSLAGGETEREAVGGNVAVGSHSCSIAGVMVLAVLADQDRRLLPHLAMHLVLESNPALMLLVEYLFPLLLFLLDVDRWGSSRSLVLRGTTNTNAKAVLIRDLF